MRDLAFPKPRRVRDPRLLRAYHVGHPRCELLSCRRRAMPLPHHIRPNGLGGPGDVEENLLSLCRLHHVGNRGAHTLGHGAWFATFQDELEPLTRRKVAAALGIEDAP